jgi:hypothetical protein
MTITVNFLFLRLKSLYLCEKFIYGTGQFNDFLINILIIKDFYIKFTGMIIFNL